MDGPRQNAGVVGGLTKSIVTTQSKPKTRVDSCNFERSTGCPPHDRYELTPRFETAKYIKAHYAAAAVLYELYWMSVLLIAN